MSERRIGNSMYDKFEGLSGRFDNFVNKFLKKHFKCYRDIDVDE